MIFLRKLLLIASALVAFLSAGCSVYASPQTRCLPWSKNYIETNADRYDEYVLNTQDYIHTVIRVLNEENLDLSWIWLMLVESGGKLNRTSKAGASGIWQMMKSTAKHYGCDNTDDIECSTRAAAKYIKKLMKDFDNDAWDAVAAYNMGGANFRKYGPNKSVKAYSGIISCLMKNRNIREDIARLHSMPETGTFLTDHKNPAMIWDMPTTFSAANDNNEFERFILLNKTNKNWDEVFAANDNNEFERFILLNKTNKNWDEVFAANDNNEFERFILSNKTNKNWNEVFAANDNNEFERFILLNETDQNWNEVFAANDNNEFEQFILSNETNQNWNEVFAANDNNEFGRRKLFDAKKSVSSAWLGSVHTSHTAPTSPSPSSPKRQAKKIADILSYASSFPLFHPDVISDALQRPVSPKRQAKKIADVLSYASSFPLFHPDVVSAPSPRPVSPKRQAEKLANTLSYASSFALLKSCTAALRLH